MSKRAIRVLSTGLLPVFLHCSGAHAMGTSDDELCGKPIDWISKVQQGKDVGEPDFKAFPCGYVPSGTAISDPTNMAFHDISWQYFAWLTESDGGKLRFEDYPTRITDFGSDQFYPASSITPEGIVDTTPMNVLGGITQAGPHGILVDQNGRAVYTTMVVNGTYLEFIENNKLYSAEGLEANATKDPDLNFPEGSMSIKASWMIVSDADKPQFSGLYTREALLYPLVTVDGIVTTADNQVDKQAGKKNQDLISAEVALVGLHIAVVVKDHPEFIWASFEFNDNAPNVVMDSDNKPVISNPDGKYLFYKSGTPFNGTNRLTTGENLQVNKDQTLSLVGSTDIFSTQVSRRHQFGGGSIETPCTPESDANQCNIPRLNNEVQNAFAENKSNSLWQHYHEVGAVWFNLAKGKLEPNWSPTSNPDLMAGSLTLSNSTIETFTQDPNQPDGCFSCHNTTVVSLPDGKQLAGQNILTSHILLVNYLEQKTDNEKDLIRGIDRTK
ncbi:Uncharacterised protein [BD1-7 clade bacterium]|nr:Uncharacterised protein [BD1-7 clade bacterium]